MHIISNEEAASTANINVTIRIDEDLKKQADELFDDLGMSFTTAINVFVRQCVREGRVPFIIGKEPAASPQGPIGYSLTSLKGE